MPTWFLLLTLLSAPGEPRKHGTWVYKVEGKPLVHSDPSGAKLTAFARRNQLTELYLSAGAAPLSDARTPALLMSLKKSGLRVEALLDSPDAARAVGEVLDFNRRHPEARFDGVHYDYEPWINTGADKRWVPKLLSVYREAREKLTDTGLGFVADISAAKLASLPEEDQQALLRAASQLVLMAYEVPADQVYRRADRWLREGTADPRTIMIATRVKDFGCSNNTVFLGLESRYGNSPWYAGWATFSYNDYLNASLCPDDCCRIKAPAAK